MAKRKTRQLELNFRARGRGGARKGAGRPPKGEKAGVPHRERKALASRYPVHVTLRLRSGLPMLRQDVTLRVLCRAFDAAKARPSMRLVHYSIQENHLHLIVEARDRRALARAMQGLCIRIAKALNKHWGRRGSVFADRYHDRILRTPREVRNALLYVLHNFKHHGLVIARAVDRYCSGLWFSGWKERVASRGTDTSSRPVTAAKTWLLREGFLRAGGRISVHAAPRRAPP